MKSVALPLASPSAVLPGRTIVALATNMGELYRRAIENIDGVPYQLCYVGTPTYTLLGSGIDRLLGIDAREFTPESWCSLVRETVIIEPAGFRDCATHVEAFRRGEVACYRADCRVELASGESKWISDCSVPIRNSDDQVTGSLGILQDISVRKQTEQALASRTRELEALIANVPDAMVRINADLHLAFANKRFSDWVGRSPAELSGRTLGHIGLPGGAPRLWGEACEQVFALGVAREVEFDAGQGSQKTRHEVRLIPEFGRGGHVESVLAIVRDVTEERAAEDRLHRLLSMDTVGALATGMVHDFQNVLAVLRGSVDAVRLAMPLDHPSSRQMDLARRAVDYAGGITRGLLNLGSPSVVTHQTVDLGELAEGVSCLLKRLLPANISQNWLLPSSKIHVMGDAVRLQQVLINLIINARDAMPQGGNIEVSCRQIRRMLPHSTEPENAPSWVRIKISDTGSGIPKPLSKRVFEPFFSTKRPLHGASAGLGLSMARKLVKEHGGRMRLKSAPQTGTVAIIDLPMCAAPAAPASVAPGMSPVGEAAIMMEDAYSRAIVATALRDAGWVVRQEAAADDANCAADESVGLCIIDDCIPGATPSETARQLFARFPCSRLLFISRQSEDTREKVHMYGAATLERPFDFAKLTQAISELCKNQEL